MHTRLCQRLSHHPLCPMPPSLGCLWYRLTVSAIQVQLASVSMTWSSWATSNTGALAMAAARLYDLQPEPHQPALLTMARPHARAPPHGCHPQLQRQPVCVCSRRPVLHQGRGIWPLLT
jgi:hypothetical protein